MKINFDGAYRDVQRLVKSQVKPEEQSGEFSPLIRDLLPPAVQAQENSRVSRQTQALTEPTFSDIRARYRFPEAEPMVPSTPALTVPEVGAGIVNDADAGVKTPTIVGARRVPDGDAFSRLPVEDRQETVRDLVRAAGLKHGIDPGLSMAVVSAESSFNTKAISSDGHASKGLMQLLDETGRELHLRMGEGGTYEPFNPSMNVDLGVSYLRRLHDMFSHATSLPHNLTTVAAANSASLEKLAVAAYNAGEGRVASAQERALHAGQDPSQYDQVEAYLPDSTQEYVSRVLSLRESYEDDFT